MICVVKETHTNAEMYEMLMSASEHMEAATGLFGYALARNVRRLQDTVLEFAQMRDGLIQKYGDEDKESGQYSIPLDSPEMAAFVGELEPLAKIEHEVEISKILPSDLSGDMTAEQILKIIWMVAEEVAPPTPEKGEVVTVHG